MTLEFHESVTSTMDVARARVLGGGLSFDAAGQLRDSGVIAWEQTAGRGQRGRNWFARPGESLCATYFAEVTLDQVPCLSLMVGVILADTLFAVVRESLPSPQSIALTPRIGLKWPNDILLNGKKVGGVLIEMARGPHPRWIALLGVGLNVHVEALPEELTPLATSLRLEGIAGCDVRSLAERLGVALRAELTSPQWDDMPRLLSRWRSYDETPGRAFTTLLDDQTVRGIAEGIDASGALLLRLEDGRSLAVTSASSLCP